MSGDVADTLARMLSAPFPSAASEPPGTFAFDAFTALATPSPRRLVHVVAAEYHDPQQAEVGQEPDPIAIELAYRERYKQAVAAAEEHLGPALNPRTDPTLWRRLDEDFTNFDQYEIAIWPNGKRLAILIFGWVFGDDDFEAAIMACVVPDDRKP